MQIEIQFGLEVLSLDVAEDRLVDVQRQPRAPALTDPVTALRDALETPLGAPALRRALIPDDHVAIIVDEHLPRLAQLLTPLLEHIASAQVAPEAMTLLCPNSSTTQEWLDELPDAFEDARLEIHDPKDRKKLSYVATTRGGRRIYLNRTLVDADQVVVFAGRSFDSQLGYAGAEGAIFPAFSDDVTRQELIGELSLAVPGDKPWAVQKEAIEVASMVGAPFLVQVIEGAGDSIAHVVTGLMGTNTAEGRLHLEEGRRLLDARWHVKVANAADTVVVSMSGDSKRQTFADMARALTCATRIVRPKGRIILLSQANPELGPGVQLLRQSQDPDEALTLLHKYHPLDMAAAFEWANAAQHAQLFVLSALAADVVEEMFALPLEKANQVQRLLSETGSGLVLNDAHKTLAEVDEGGDG